MTQSPVVVKRARTNGIEQTDAEAKLWRALRNRQLDGFKFRRQVSIHRLLLHRR